MRKAFWKGKGYKAKLFGMLESVPAYFYYRWFDFYVSRNAIKPKRKLLKKYGNWFIDNETFQMANSLLPITDQNSSQKALSREFSLLGGEFHFVESKIDWHIDPYSGYLWGKRYYKRLHPVFNPYDNTDGKMPYELSRFQHLPFLIKGYFTCGDDEYIEEIVRQVSHWIDENPLCYGINWTCAMEVAIRACNWMWVWCAFKDHPVWTDEFNKKFLKSVWQHGWYIEHNLEDKGGIRTNHYLSDIVGLLFIGIMFPQFREAERWKNFGVKELIRSMDEMVYSDGVSFENSMAYHRLVLEFFAYSAILCQKNDIELPQEFWQRLEKMFEFIMYCTRPDGRMPMIGDADDGRFFILSDYYNWDRWDFRYLLSIGAVLFKRLDFKLLAGRVHEEIFWLFGEDGVEQYGQL